VHLDVDVLDFVDMPLAENTRRNAGLRFDQLMAALGPFLRAPNWTALTVCELNPDHGERDGSTLQSFAKALSNALAASPRMAEDLMALRGLSGLGATKYCRAFVSRLRPEIRTTHHAGGR